jgi:threonine dehydrogenase-like Zn-dependent dehydrogenase
VLGIKGRDGAHAEYLTLPARNLVVLPDEVSDREAVFIEPLSAAIGITEQVSVSDNTTIAVIGDGKLGLLCAFALSVYSNKVTLVGKHASKLILAESRGIETALAAKVGHLKTNFDVVVEASGSETGFGAALDLVKPRGKIVLKSTFSGEPTWEAFRVVVDEITVVGSRCGRFEPAIDLLKRGLIDLDGLIVDEFRLEDGVQAIKRASEKGCLKVLLNNH